MSTKQQVNLPRVVSISVESEDNSTPTSIQLEPPILWKDQSPVTNSRFLFVLSAGPIRLGPLEVVRVTLKATSKTSQTPALILTKPILYRFEEIV